jgi:hypothetical protein
MKLQHLLKNNTARTVSAHLLGMWAVSSYPLYTYAVAFTNPIRETTLQGLLTTVLNSLIYILFPIIVLMIVYTGFLFVSAQGNESKLSEAKRALVWTVIGGLVVLGSVALAEVVRSTVETLRV